MLDDSTQPVASAWTYIRLSTMLACFGLLLCSFPFLPPQTYFVVPLCAISLLLLVRALLVGARQSNSVLFIAFVSLAVATFALYLAVTGHHLLDLLEGR